MTKIEELFKQFNKQASVSDETRDRIWSKVRVNLDNAKSTSRRPVYTTLWAVLKNFAMGAAFVPLSLLIGFSVHSFVNTNLYSSVPYSSINISTDVDKTAENAEDVSDTDSYTEDSDIEYFVRTPDVTANVQQEKSSEVSDASNVKNAILTVGLWFLIGIGVIVVLISTLMIVRFFLKNK